MSRRKFLPIAAFSAAFALVAVSAATARPSGGSKDIANAQMIPLNATVEGYLGDDTPNYDNYYEAEFYKVVFQAGDHVDIKSISAGDATPCGYVYAPGVDDFNINDRDPIQDHETTNTNHWEGNFIAPTNGTYVLAMTDYCNSSAYRWSYSFVVEAPHGLHIALPSGRLAAGTNHIHVTVRNALNETLNDPSLTIGLATQWPHTPAKQIQRAHVKNGVATFTFKIPKSKAGSTVKLIAGAGDNINYVSVSTGRTYRIS